MINENIIYNEMYNTYLSILPYELLEIILDMTAFKNHTALQYKLNKEIIRYYVNNYFNLEYYAEYYYNEEDDILLIEMNYN
jgi:hypothetical protein|tara:strand:+ start:2210 stop:2452 length:243 start_codon:yes stop_codon:yes gene_type:complete